MRDISLSFGTTEKPQESEMNFISEKQTLGCGLLLLSHDFVNAPDFDVTVILKKKKMLDKVEVKLLTKFWLTKVWFSHLHKSRKLTKNE